MPGRSPAEITAFLAEEFPAALAFPCEITSVGALAIEVRLRFDALQLRPGGTIMGPTLMTLADTATYFLLLATQDGLESAVTSSLHMDFLRRPSPTDCEATAELLKRGRSLAVARVTIRSVGDPTPVAHATVTYSLPVPGPAVTQSG